MHVFPGDLCWDLEKAVRVRYTVDHLANCTPYDITVYTRLVPSEATPLHTAYIRRVVLLISSASYGPSAEI